jgi:hypothetical protein
MFGYLLAVERRRADRSRRPFLLLCVDAADEAGKQSELQPAVARKVFASLAGALRETDSVGWSRRAYVAGALVTELGEAPKPEVVELVRQKVTKGLRESLGGDLGRGLRLRVSRYPGSGVADPEVSSDSITHRTSAAPETRSGQWTAWLRRTRDRVGTGSRRARTGKAGRLLPTRREATAAWRGASHAPGEGQC